MQKRGLVKVVRIAEVGVALVMVLLAVSNCVDRNDPSAVAHELVDAFVDADLERAKAVTTEELWGHLSELMAGREPVQCRRGALMESWGGGNGVGIGDEFIWSAYYQCPSQETPYCLEITDIRIRWSQDGWQIYAFGGICEVPDYCYRCAEMYR